MSTRKGKTSLMGTVVETVVYKSPDGSTLDINLSRDTIWLSIQQLAMLFDRDKSVISRHLSSIFRTRELRKESVVAKNATTAADGKSYQVEFYNLDAIISVGYRVNSKRGTEFRIWATNILKMHLLKGRLTGHERKQLANLKELQAAVDIVGRIVSSRPISGSEAESLLRVITDYSLALGVLDAYDHRSLQLRGTSENTAFVLTAEKARSAIAKMAEMSQDGTAGLFGKEKDKGLEGAIGAIYQTYDGCDLYRSTEEKAAHLLYFVVKDHAFTDGNKRIGAFLFIWFLDANGLLYRDDGSKRVADNALVALTLLIAESNPDEKATICKVIVNLINRENL